MYGEGPSQWEETKGTRNAVLEPWSSVLKPGLDLSSLRGTLASLGIFLPFLSSLCSMCSPWHSHGDDFQVGCPCLVCHTQPLQQDKSWNYTKGHLSLKSLLFFGYISFFFFVSFQLNRNPPILWAFILYNTSFTICVQVYYGTSNRRPDLLMNSVASYSF